MDPSPMPRQTRSGDRFLPAEEIIGFPSALTICVIAIQQTILTVFVASALYQNRNVNAPTLTLTSLAGLTGSVRLMQTPSITMHGCKGNRSFHRDKGTSPCAAIDRSQYILPCLLVIINAILGRIQSPCTNQFPQAGPLMALAIWAGQKGSTKWQSSINKLLSLTCQPTRICFIWCFKPPLSLQLQLAKTKCVRSYGTPVAAFWSCMTRTTL
jgi:hypothetical protein